MNRDHSSISLGLVLILIGLGLMLHRLDLLNFDFEQIYPIVALAVGGFSAVAVARGDKNSVFWSGFLLLFGGLTFLRNYSIVDSLWSLSPWSLLMVCLGMAFFALYFFKPKDWGVLIPGSLLSFIGLLMILHDLDYSWFELAKIKSLWPVVLIVIGIGILVSSFRKKPN